MNALLTYRRLTETDIPTFVAMRITQLKEEGAQSDLDLEPALTTYYQKHLTDGTFVSCWRWTENASSGQAECPLWKSRRITAIPQERSDCCPVCIPIRTTADRALPGNCWIAWWKRREPADAALCGSPHPKWVCCCILRMDSRKTDVFLQYVL